ncbi:DUF3801 domain-containing protein [Enterococcus faecalis]|nr:DUF3801 domain-containing protein [Enterococcus faecalis]
MAEKDDQVVELVARTEKATLKWLLELMKNYVSQTSKKSVTKVKNTIKQQQTTGHQRYGQLQKSGALEHVDVNKTDLSAIKKELKSYKVDFAIRHNKETGKYHVFFKAKDRDTLNLALENVLVKFGKEQELTQEKGKESHTQEPVKKEKKATLDERLKEAKIKADKLNAERNSEKDAVKSKSKGQER